MTDPREKKLTDAAREIVVASGYDPHFASTEERLTMETKLFLARIDALVEYIPIYGTAALPGGVKR